MIDGFVSRPSIREAWYGFDQKKHRGIVETTYENLGFKKQITEDQGLKLTAAVTLHSHFDHAMDLPIIIETFGADLVGSESSFNLVKKYANYYNPDSNIIESRLMPVSQNGHNYGNIYFTLQKANHSVPSCYIKKSAQSFFAPLCPNGENCRDISADHELRFNEKHWTKNLHHGQAYNVLVRYQNKYFYFYSGPTYPADTSNSFKTHFEQLNTNSQKPQSIHVFIATPAYQSLLDSTSQNNHGVVTDFWSQFSSFSNVNVLPMHWDNFFKPLNTSQLANMPWPISRTNRKTHALMKHHAETKLNASFKEIRRIGKVGL